MSINLLVIDNSTSPNWYEIFKNEKIGEKKLKVEQASWWDIVLESSPNQPKVLLKAVQDGLYQQSKDRILIPDIVLIRNFPNNLHGVSYENILKGLAFSGIPAINSFSSILQCQSKPIVYGELLKLKKKLSSQKIDFPLIEQYYYPNIPSSDLSYHLQQIPSEKFPLVAKIGTIHAGMGKMLLQNEQQLNDFQSCISLTNYYYTLEPFIKDAEFDYRLQKIGANYRVYTRRSESPEMWKNNMGKVVYQEAFAGKKKEEKEEAVVTKQLEQIPEKFIIWMNEVSQLFGGLDIFALDVLHSKEGDFIIELNDTAMGLMFQFEKEDSNDIKELVLDKCKQLLA